MQQSPIFLSTDLKGCAYENGEMHRCGQRMQLDTLDWVHVFLWSDQGLRCPPLVFNIIIIFNFYITSYFYTNKGEAGLGLRYLIRGCFRGTAK